MISEAAMKATPPIPLEDLTVPGGVLHGLQMTRPMLEAARNGFDKMLEQRAKHHHNQENQYGDLDAPIPSSPMLHCAPLWISEGENDGDDEDDNIFLRMPTPPLQSAILPSLWGPTPTRTLGTPTAES
ncbi:hypothetical protein AUP68_17434 [Ilyonectria robusta]